jgi:hypothetical protein
MSTDVLLLVAIGAVVLAAVGTYMVKTLKRRK